MNTDVEQIRSSIHEHMPAVRGGLERLIRIPSVSAKGFDPAHVRASAEASADLLAQAGLADVRLLEQDGAHPAVFGELPAPEGTPTLLLYAHHDVQPPGDASLWDSPPFEPTEREGRLYGRGSNDDKAGVAVHVGALLAHRGKPPIGLKVFIEGEEETGSEHLSEFLEEYGDLLAADAIVLADAGNWKRGVPALGISCRGVVDCVVEVRTLEYAVHSGVYGGVAPDALTVLARTLATLHDDEGNVAIPNLATAPRPDLELPEDEYRAEVGATPGLHLVGRGTISERLWSRPAVSVLGIDAPRVAESSNQLVPVARARVSLRIPPGQDENQALEVLVRHLENAVPWGAKVTVTDGAAAPPYAIRAEGPAYDAARRALRDAWDHDPVDMGGGGTIPLIAAFGQAFPEAAILCTGVEDEDGRSHGENESVHLGELERGCVAEALLLSYLAPD